MVKWFWSECEMPSFAYSLEKSCLRSSVCSSCVEDNWGQNGNDIIMWTFNVIPQAWKKKQQRICWQRRHPPPPHPQISLPIRTVWWGLSLPARIRSWTEKTGHTVLSRSLVPVSLLFAYEIRLNVADGAWYTTVEPQLLEHRWLVYYS